MKYQIGILGGGPGGYVCALRAAQLGLAVVLVEGERIGGTCLNKGCIPTKALVRSAEMWRDIKHAENFGIQVGNAGFDFAKVAARKDQVVNALVSGVERLIKAAKITYVQGWGQVHEAGTIEVETESGLKIYEVENLVLATGSAPARIPIPGIDLPGVVNSDEILNMTELPQRLVIIGGGVIGLEFASIYREFGVEVTVVEMLPSLLANIDEEIPKRMTPLLKKTGIQIMTKTTLKEIHAEGSELRVVVEDAKGSKEIPADKVLVATGRRPNLRGVDVEGLGLKTERSALVVNEKMQTSVPHIYAIGDVIGGIMLAHVASMEGIVATENIAGQSAAANYDAIPSAIFTYPEIATVGQTEQALKEAGVKYRVSKFPFSANGKAIALGETVGLVKIIADEQGKVLGGSIMGPQASSMIEELVLAAQKGLNAEDLVHTIHAHPTLPEAVMEAAHGILGKPLHLA